MKKIKVLVAVLFVAIAGSFLFANDNIVRADVSADVTIEQGVYIGGIDVSGMTAEEATNAVNAYVDSIKAQTITLVGPNGNLSYTLEEMGLTAKTDAAVSEAVSVGHLGNLVFRFKTLQDLGKENYVIDMGLAIDKQAVAEKIYKKVDKINIETIDNGLTLENGSFVYVPGHAGNEVDIVASVNALSDYVATEWELAAVENDQFQLTSITAEPRGTQEELAVVKDLIGTFTTDYSTSAWGRCRNVENAASKINGTILFPGDQLSVYELINPINKENGYELAGAYVNGETVSSYGGGVCQVSTTLYNAALEAELDITMRYNHSMTVSYVPVAADAAIAGTYKDLRFVNNYDFPVYIEGTCRNKKITFNIYGVETRPANRKVTFESVIVSTNDPLTEFKLDPAQALGVFSQTRGEHIGYVSEYYKIVTVDGVQQERTRLNRSTYSASCRKVTIGIAGATPEQINAINAAIATGDDAVVQATVASFAPPAVAPEVAPAPVPEATPPAQDPSGV